MKQFTPGAEVIITLSIGPKRKEIFQTDTLRWNDIIHRRYKLKTEEGKHKGDPLWILDTDDLIYDSDSTPYRLKTLLIPQSAIQLV